MIGKSYKPGCKRQISQFLTLLTLSVASLPVLAQNAESSFGAYGTLGTVTNADDRYEQPIYGEVGFLYQSGNMTFGLGYVSLDDMNHKNTDVAAYVEQAGPALQVGYEWDRGNWDVALNAGVISLKRTAYFNERQVYNDTETLPFVDAKVLWPMWSQAEGYAGIRVIDDSSSDTWVVPSVGLRVMF